MEILEGGADGGGIEAGVVKGQPVLAVQQVQRAAQVHVEQQADVRRRLVGADKALKHRVVTRLE